MNPSGPDIPLEIIIIVIAIGITFIVIQLLFSVFTSVLYGAGNIIGIIFKKIREILIWMGLSKQQSGNVILILAVIVNISICLWIIISQ